MAGIEIVLVVTLEEGIALAVIRVRAEGTRYRSSGHFAHQMRATLGNMQEQEVATQEQLMERLTR